MLRTRWTSLLAAFGLAAACGGGGSDSPAGMSGGVPRIAGVYTYESDATTMACPTGSVPLPAVRDTLTITQDGNRFTGTLSVAASISAPAGAAFFQDCLLNSDSTYTCNGQFRDPNAVINFSGRGRFTATGFTGSLDLVMTLTGGMVCTWTKQERGTKIG